MHILDLIMYFVTAGIISKVLDEDLLAAMVLPIYTIVYIILFAIWPDWNWSDFNYASWFTW